MFYYLHGLSTSACTLLLTVWQIIQPECIPEGVNISSLYGDVINKDLISLVLLGDAKFYPPSRRGIFLDSSL